MNIQKLLSTETHSRLAELSAEIIQLCKTNKIFITHNYSEKDDRVRGVTQILEVMEAFGSKEHTFFKEQEGVDSLKPLIHEMSELLENRRIFQFAKIKDFLKDQRKLFAREIVPHLELEFILTRVSLKEIKEIYSILDRKIPRKFLNDCINTNEQDLIFAQLKSGLADKSEHIKTATNEHYINTFKRIDPNNENYSEKTFVEVLKTKISDLSTIRMLFAYKFDRELYNKMIDESMDFAIITAAIKISSFLPEKSQEIEIKETSVGSKGLDVLFEHNGIRRYARAIPVEGYFVSFHYRWIIT